MNHVIIIGLIILIVLATATFITINTIDLNKEKELKQKLANLAAEFTLLEESDPTLEEIETFYDTKILPLKREINKFIKGPGI